MSLVILTKSPVFNFKDFIRRIKSFIKFLLGQKRGPDVVVDSLLKGLKELNFDFKFNISASKIKPDDIVYINGSLEALKWAIEAKKKGKIKKLIVGPVMSVLPTDHNSIMLNKEIDLILFPSHWTKNHWLSMVKDLDNKIKIWPAGVVVSELNNDKKDTVLIYYKNAPKELFSFIIKFFSTNKIEYRVIKYGKYSQNKYFGLLNKTKYAIFLSESESQGIAMFEAWAHNVPTIVWNRGYWQSGSRNWSDEKISAPYLNAYCGMFFADENDFVDKFNLFVSKISAFSPREYIINNFTNKKIAENFTKLINE